MTDVLTRLPAAVQRGYLTHSQPLWRRALTTHDAVMMVILVIVSTVAVSSIPRFGTPLTLSYLLLDVTPILLCALPAALILISGEIDLSVASAVGISNVMLGWLYAQGAGIELAMVAGVLCGLVVGVVNGFLVAVLGLPSLAVTIGTLALFRGVAVGMLGTDSITNFPVELKSLANANFPGSGVPIVTVVLVLAIVVFGIVLHLTPFGRSVDAIGRGRDTARFSGVRTARATFLLFALSGLVAGLVGVFYTFRYGSARGDNAAGLELAVIAGVVLGGVSIFGGRGRIAGVVAGVLLIGLIQSVLRFLNNSADVINIAVGGLLVLSVVIPLLAGRISQAVATARRPSPASTAAGHDTHRKGDK
ncbi:ABC transporter permease [Microbacterium sp. E-13]|uniref:ABC transporter permease n=1 Tax=Microbacterium sp. E-13 TaxID=3404048 RepID=UPI003CF8612C